MEEMVGDKENGREMKKENEKDKEEEEEGIKGEK